MIDISDFFLSVGFQTRHLVHGTESLKHCLPLFLLFSGSLDPVVQSIVSLTNSVMVKILTVLVSTISNS